MPYVIQGSIFAVQTIHPMRPQGTLLLPLHRLPNCRCVFSRLASLPEPHSLLAEIKANYRPLSPCIHSPLKNMLILRLACSCIVVLRYCWVNHTAVLLLLSTLQVLGAVRLASSAFRSLSRHLQLSLWRNPLVLRRASFCIQIGTALLLGESYCGTATAVNYLESHFCVHPLWRLARGPQAPERVPEESI